MKLYRVKKEAIPFVLEKHATKIYSLQVWEELGFCEKALEVVEPMYIRYGKRRSEISSTLGGWNKEEGTSFEFTIYFPSVSFYENDKFTNGKMTRELMDRIQSQIDGFYTEFVNEEHKDKQE